MTLISAFILAIFIVFPESPVFSHPASGEGAVAGVRAVFPVLQQETATADSPSDSLAPADFFAADDSLVTYAGREARLTVSKVSDRTVKIELAPLTPQGDAVPAPASDILVDHPEEELWSIRSIGEPVTAGVGEIQLELLHSPLRIIFRRTDGSVVQELAWPDESGAMHFKTPAPVFGLGHGGPQFDRRGNVYPMRDGWGAYERPTHGSRIATPMLIGVDGWSVFVHHPISRENEFDLSGDRGVFRPDVDMLDHPLTLFVTSWEEPAQALSEYRLIAGATPMPPKWSLGYMQSHRTLDSREQLLQVANNFRARNLPADALIYLGTGFTPSGWNRGHGSFEFNPEIFPDPRQIFTELKNLNFNIVLHTYSPPVGLHGLSVDEAPDDSIHIRNYWRDFHEPVFNLGVDGWWPDGGEPLSSSSRVARYRMYWEGPLLSRPNVRPWNLNRTGYSGVHRYGGWIWSGDPDSYWETLKTQMAVGLNHVVSLTPFWGSDTGGFLPSEELTGELYIRWFQFSAFTASFRSHGRAWHLRLPWGWNNAELGPAEVDAFSDAFEGGYPHPEELRNGLVEPIAREYLHLRYRLLPYSYTLLRETHDTGMPPMRAMWLHYPDDSTAVRLADQFMWGRDLLVAPVYEQGAAQRTLYLPDGLWYDFWTHEAVQGGSEIIRQVDLATLPLYVRGGSILPLDPVRQYTSQQVDEPTTFRIYPGADGVYRWYRDDGVSQDYLRGDYSWIRLNWDDEAGTLTIEPDTESNGRAPRPEQLRFELVGTEETGEERLTDWQGTERTEQGYRKQIERAKTVDWDGTRAVIRFRE